jgi:hypothetical protein
MMCNKGNHSSAEQDKSVLWRRVPRYEYERKRRSVEGYEVCDICMLIVCICLLIVI